MKRIGRWVLACLLLGLLVACGQSRVVRRDVLPASSPRPPAVAPIPRGDQYTVRRGDTLYGIAFRHGLDFRDVAGWNRIQAPYTIYPGQRLRLRGGSSAAAPRAATAPSRPVAPATRPGGQGFQTVASPPAASPATPTATPTATPALPPATSAPVATPPASTTLATPPPSPTASAPAVISAQGWTWPTQGALIGRYVAGDPTRQGIDIAGTAGQPVLATAGGVVVYSGTGLVGYGEVIIVKHSDEWLSAYGHNRRRLVAEGAVVKAGQAIAELGRSGTSRDMLHFEIRRNGKAVDPLSLLPPR